MNFQKYPQKSGKSAKNSTKSTYISLNVKKTRGHRSEIQNFSLVFFVITFQLPKIARIESYLTGMQQYNKKIADLD